MTHSANELQTLATKAARGAGFPPAQADLFGRACPLHLAQGGGAAPLIAALANPADSPILRLPLLMDDVLSAAAAMSGPIELTLHNGDDTLAQSYAHLLPVAVQDQSIITRDAQHRLRITVDLSAKTCTALPPRIIAPSELLNRLETLAARTYVPATDASRRTGAGAGLIEND
ncbi:hypothetical protein [Puniceibacterium sp. IMCC21224]|uniref:hypothetical protein n=1 Tax=Puniceibacterium sp. IMCC21224 TaxID=1618204 RepID=UPI00064E064C|nr:hypothetical protein [Puniceibacterium sp. IMCC21224]KMK66779.1 Protein of unknown function (DUF3726) [Puniceibacterium sp. IMCC21224]